MDSDTHVEFIDLFCGAGGSGTGIVGALEALGLPHHGTFVDKNAMALKTHEANHPQHKHLLHDIETLNPRDVCPGKQVDIIWASPECTHFSRARGGLTKDPGSRQQATTVLDWVLSKRPGVFLCENVVEFLGWGPLMQKKDPVTGRRIYVRDKTEIRRLPSGLGRVRGETETRHWERLAESGIKPLLVSNPACQGEYFSAWVRALESAGYEVEHKVIRSADYGAATIRKRLFIQAVRRNTGMRVCWPNPTHTKLDRYQTPPPGIRRWVSAVDVVDLADIGESVFNRDRPLVPATWRRLASGLLRYGLKDFILPKDRGWDARNLRSMWEPISTITSYHTGERYARCVLQELDTGRTVQVLGLRNLELPEQVKEVREALDTVAGCGTTRGLLLEYDPILYADTQEGFEECGVGDLFRNLYREIKEGEVRAIRPWLYLYFTRGSPGSDIDAPVTTSKTRAHIALCSPVVLLRGKHFLLDIRMRMLRPDELALAQGFPADYRLLGTKTNQLNAVGMSVSPPVSRALTLAALTQQEDIREWMTK